MKKQFFFLSWFSFTNIHRTAGEGGGYIFHSFLPLPPASQTLRHYPDDYCRELVSTHSQQPDSKWEPLVSERKSLTTKLRALSFFFKKYYRLLDSTVKRKITYFWKNHVASLLTFFAHTIREFRF